MNTSFLFFPGLPRPAVSPHGDVIFLIPSTVHHGAVGRMTRDGTYMGDLSCISTCLSHNS